MGRDDTVTARLTRSELKLALGRVINSPHKELIVDSILSGFETEAHTRKLVFALSGITREFNYKMLDTVLLKVDHLPTWRVDVVKMRQKEMFFQGKFRGTVIKIDTDRDVVEVRFLGYKKNSDNLIFETITVSDIYVHDIEKDPDYIEFTE